MKLYLYILLYHIYPFLITSESLEDCELGNYCGSIRCSTHGNCNINLIETIFNNLTISNLKLSCECHTGYSSYNIKNHKNKDRELNCCYKQKSHVKAFFLEIFLGCGIGHFYLGNIRFGLSKFIIQLILYFLFWCLMYSACNKEHTIIVNMNEINKKEEMANKKLEKKKKEKEKENEENNELNEEEEDINKNSESSKNLSYDEEEDKINELMSKNLIKCPLSKFFIIISIILYISIWIIDACLMGFGFHTDGNGEKLNMWN